MRFSAHGVALRGMAYMAVSFQKQINQCCKRCEETAVWDVRNSTKEEVETVKDLSIIQLND
jgi:hypothetical protein